MSSKLELVRDSARVFKVRTSVKTGAVVSTMCSGVGGGGGQSISTQSGGSVYQPPPSMYGGSAFGSG